MTTRSRKLTVVSAGLSQPSSTSLLAERLATASGDALQEQGVEVATTTIELREHAHDLTDNLLTFFASDALQRAKDTVAEADGVVAVTPIFSASYNGLFKNFFDLLDEDVMVGKPVLLAATAGTARHSLALEHAIRPLFTYLRALTTPTAVFAAAEDWGNDHTIDGGLIARIERAASEFAALVAEREPAAAVTPELTSPSFEQLLGTG